MERINPPEIMAWMVRGGQVIQAPATLQELGIYSSVFINATAKTTTDLMLEHTIFGKLVRTKGADSDEGGVVAGFSVVDQPYLTPEIGSLSPGIVIKPLISNII
jgi:glutathione synthase